MATPRFNLRNASLYLNKLKNKYQKPNNNEEDNIYDNTFIDEEEQLTSNPSIQKLSSKKIDSPNTERFQTEHLPKLNSPERVIPPQPIQAVESQALKSKVKQTEFCDLIVIKYLQETLAIYKGDLEILEHNRQNLQQEIYFIGKKIGKFHQMAAQNASMKLQVDQLNQDLREIIAQYHQSNKRVFKQKIAVGKVFRKYQNKLKRFLLYQNHNSDSQSYLKPDSFTTAYLDQYSAFLNFKKEQSIQIQKTLQNSELYQKEKNKFAKELFEGKEQLYLHQQFDKLKQKAPPKVQEKLQQSDQKKQKKVVLYDEFSHKQQPQKDLKLKDGKPKKLSEAQKMLLLGDLKNFSKSFKLPK